MIAPSGVALDPAGNVYFTSNPKVGYASLVKIPASDAPSVLAGWNGGQNADNTFTYPFGVAVDAGGNAYVADGVKGIVKVTPTGIASVLNTGNLKLNPMGLALDPAQNIYVADTGNNRLVKLSTLAAVNFGDIALGTTPGLTRSLSFNVDASTTLGSVPVKALTLGASSLDFQVASSGTTCLAGTTNSACVVNVTFLRRRLDCGEALWCFTTTVITPS